MLPIPDLIATCEREVRRVWGVMHYSAHDIAHLYRVWDSCQDISRGEGGSQSDLHILAPAAMLHHIVIPPRDSPERARAAHLSADHAARFLATLPYPEDYISQVAHAIRAHPFQGDVAPRTRLAKILRDADGLEALGALGIARNMLLAGQTGGAICHPTDPLAHNRALNGRAYALDQWQLKLYPISRGLQTNTAKGMAKTRLALMQLFQDQLVWELGQA